ncbi:MAG: DUF4097 family beta strand repeat protein [Clostridia bacterium]|nr:DUF4097 family beta strand repeat protein [Clostridia bacterium]
MKKNIVAVLVAILLLIAGIAITGAAFIMTDFNLEGFATESFEESTYTIEGTFNHVLIATQEHDLTILPSENGECQIVCDESKAQTIEYAIDSDVLVIKIVDNRKWFDHIGIFSGEVSMTLYLPESHYTSLTAATDTGDITVSDGLSFTGSSVATSTGDIKFLAKIDGELGIASSTGDITVLDQVLTSLEASVSTGEIFIENVKASDDITLESSTGRTELHSVEAGKITSKGSTGDILLKNVYVEKDIIIKRSTGDVTLTSTLAGAFEIETSTGDIKLNLSDAEEIDINTDTGRVEGTLLTEKIFITESSSGSIKVPHTTSGGTCKIRTDTGDITITIE